MTVRWQGFATGFLGLAALDVMVGTKNASSALGGMAAGAGNLARKILSPAVPAFSSSASSSAASSAARSAANAPSNPPGVSQGGNEPGGVGPPTTVPPNPQAA